MSVQSNATTCSTIQANYQVAEFREQTQGAQMQPNWEGCASTGAYCLLDPTNATASQENAATSSCEQGSVSPYFLAVRTPLDVQRALAFSESHGVPLSIKSSGHDYKGHSISKGSLGLWSGAGLGDVYAFADKYNVTAIGGYVSTVSMSGGWVQIQFRLVTPDGIYRVANKCQNSDLFWALRGGGGGTFGVVFDATHTVELATPIQVYTPTSINTTLEFYDIVINNTAQWKSEGWGGHVSGPGLIYVNPLISLQEAQDSMDQVGTWAAAHNGSCDISTVANWQAFNLKYLVDAQAPVGRALIGASALLPTSAFTTAEGRKKVLDLMTTNLIDYGIMSYVPVVGSPAALNTGATAVNPAWYSTVWELTASDIMPFGASISEVKELYIEAHHRANAIQAAFPGSGVYFNEGEVYQTNHTTAFWGDNYPRLLEVKTKYDPSHLLDVWQGVGWKGAQDPLYECYFDDIQ
ncbi:hypothetical protein RQP46_004797 [Phenoliferia psychrophenolica]